MKSSRQRNGYALMLTLAFVALLLSIYGVAYSYTTAALRVDAVRALQQQRDQGSIQATARALSLLETGIPAVSPYSCAMTLQTPAGSRTYTVTFQLESVGSWSVRCAPTKLGELPPPIPMTFAPPMLP